MAREAPDETDEVLRAQEVLTVLAEGLGVGNAPLGEPPAPSFS